jgi:23S rRNA (uracil1939-C5)-methyltransferase
VKPFELTATKMVAGGMALARQEDGRVVLLEGALPGERVLAREQSRKRDFVRARTIEVVEASAARRDAPCPSVARGCGGCDWQHVDPADQLTLKTAVAQDALERTGRIPGVTLAPGGALPERGYRTTLRLALDRDGVPGFRGSRSHRVIAIDRCLVAHPDLEALLPHLRLPGADELILRIGTRTGERLARWSPPNLPRPRSLPDDVRCGPEAAFHDVVDGFRLRVSANAFFQSCAEAAELLTAAVRRAAGDAEAWRDGTVVDAYGGIGLFAATIVPAETAVVVVESNRDACVDAAVNLASRIDRPARIDNVAVEAWRPVPASLVIADPARAGLGPEAVAKLAATGARRLVLVSCDPVAFARDARLLTATGYHLVSGEVLDLFPNTHHLEVVGAFESRRSRP